MAADSINSTANSSSTSGNNSMSGALSDLQNQANQLTQMEMAMKTIDYQVQTATAAMETSNAITNAAGTAFAQVAQGISSAGRA